LRFCPKTFVRDSNITQQCRADDVAMVESAYRSARIKAEVGKFFTDLPQRMGGVAPRHRPKRRFHLSELTVIGRPAILIPYPFAMDDHQAANAAVLEKAGAAWVIKQDQWTPTLAALLKRFSPNQRPCARALPRGQEPRPCRRRRTPRRSAERLAP